MLGGNNQLMNLFRKKRPRWVTALIIMYAVLLIVVAFLAYTTIFQAKCNYSVCMDMCSDNLGALGDTYQQDSAEQDCFTDVKGEFDRIFVPSGAE